MSSSNSLCEFVFVFFFGFGVVYSTPVSRSPLLLLAAAAEYAPEYPAECPTPDLAAEQVSFRNEHCGS